jgi:G:T-mismatch repair DNA endonuclease (very short patch repair protein)
MADVHDKLTRSFNMSQIKGKNTKPEMLVRKIFACKWVLLQITQRVNKNFLFLI